MLLEVKNLVTSFQAPRPDGGFDTVRAVNDVSFTLDAGETLGIVGESGSGKSVTALSIIRLIQEPPGKIAEGQILFEGHDLLKLPAGEMRKIRGNSISMIFQEPMTSLNPVFTVGNQIEEAILLHQNVSKKIARKRAIEMLDLVGIPDPAKRITAYPHEMSGGQRQRVMIAMALACEPKLLIADEPTTALDVTIQAQILELIRDLQKKMNMAVMMITHDFGVIAEVADKVAVMYAGKIVEEADVRTIFDKPQHPYTKALQKAIPDVTQRSHRLYSIPGMVPSLQEIAAGVDLNARFEEIEQDLENFGKVSAVEGEHQIEDESILSVNEWKVHYPVRGGIFGRQVDSIRAVDGVSFEIKKGETLGLVGESGCGKSTLGKSLLRLIDPTDGEARFDQHNLRTAGKDELRHLRKRLQIIFQDPYSSLNPRMKVGSILAEPLIIHGLCKKSELKDKVMQLLEIVGLRPESYYKYPHEFSGGQRQRIGIARALAVEPGFIIADEPVSALDVSIQAQILNLMQELQKEFSLTYLFISHDLNVVQYLCDRILVMYKGKIVEELLPEQVSDPAHEKHPYTEALLSAIPKKHPDEVKERKVLDASLISQ